MGGLRFDPGHTNEELREALERAAEAAWGADALPDLRRSLELTADAIALISRHPLDPKDVEP